MSYISRLLVICCRCLHAGYWFGQIIVQVDSKAQDLLEAGKVALEAIGEDRAAADMKGGSAAADSIELEVNWYIHIYIELTFGHG